MENITNLEGIDNKFKSSPVSAEVLKSAIEQYPYIFEGFQSVYRGKVNDIYNSIQESGTPDQIAHSDLIMKEANLKIKNALRDGKTKVVGTAKQAANDNNYSEDKQAA